MTKTMPVSTAARILIEARRRLVEEGWIQGHAATAAGRCALGALTAAEHFVGGSHDDRERAILLLTQAMNGWRWRLRRRSMVQWNDAYGRTKEEVLAAFDKAITKELRLP